MKLVKIKINNRVEKILNFDTKGKQYNNHYILRYSDDYQPLELFSISTNAILINEKNKIKLTITEIKEDSSNNILNVFFGEANAKSKKPEFANPLEQTNNRWVYRKPKPQDSNQYELRFHLVLGNNYDSTISIFFHYSSCDTTFDALIDFGSEASQATWWDSSDPHPINLTESIRRQHASSINSMSDSEFVQFENETLYKSIYYIKKDLGSSPNHTVWPDYGDDNWKFLISNKTEINDLSDYMQLPNSKLLQFDLSKFAKLTVKENNKFKELKRLGGSEKGIVERKLLNNIVLQILKAIQENAEDEAYIVLNILMPNVYPIHITSQKLNQLAEDIDGLIEKNRQNEEKSFSKIKAVELHAVSESDASLLGYINGISNANQDLPLGNYLIMDAGKGTLDFSIMEVAERGCPYINKSRAGIVGAGNAITYGLLVGLVNDFLCLMLEGYKEMTDPEKRKKIQEFIFHTFFDGNDAVDGTKTDNTEKNSSNKANPSIDIAELGQLLAAIEKYKKVYNQLYIKKGNPNSVVPKDEALDDIKGLTIDLFKQWIISLSQNNTNLSQESQDFVTIEIENIANEAIRKMGDLFDSIKTAKKNKTTKDDGSFIKQVVFTGRGFLMKELQDVMMNRLLEFKIINDNTHYTTPEEEDMKKGCMNINELLITDQYDASPSRQTIGLVILSHNEDKSDNTPHPKTKKEEKNGTPYTEQYIGNRFGVQPASGTMRTFEGNIEGEGVPLKGITNATKISVGGWLYNIKPYFENKDCTLYFDGTHYWITADNVDSQRLQSNIQSKFKTPLVFESLFPNLFVTDESQVKIPERMEKPNLNYQEENIGNSKEEEAPRVITLTDEYIEESEENASDDSSQEQTASTKKEEKSFIDNIHDLFRRKRKNKTEEK